jgi:hypothetical protein
LFVFLHCWFVYGKVSAWLLTLRWSTVSIQKNWKNFEKKFFLEIFVSAIKLLFLQGKIKILLF